MRGRKAQKSPRPKETPVEFFSQLGGLGLNLTRRRDLPRKINVKHSYKASR